MFDIKIRNHRPLEFAQGGYLALAMESFLVDRKASGCTRSTIEFYALHLKHFSTHCDHHAITQIQEITANFENVSILLISST